MKCTYNNFYHIYIIRNIFKWQDTFEIKLCAIDHKQYNIIKTLKKKKLFDYGDLKYKNSYTKY